MGRITIVPAGVLVADRAARGRPVDHGDGPVRRVMEGDGAEIASDRISATGQDDPPKGADVARSRGLLALLTLALLAGAIPAFAASPTRAQASRPDIVYIFTDDQDSARWSICRSCGRC